MIWVVHGVRGRMVVGFITNHNQCLLPLTLWGVLDTTLCDRVCRWLATGLEFSPDTPVSSLQSRARTHAVLVIGLYELLGNPTT
jgi:hypothetical protein